MTDQLFKKAVTITDVHFGRNGNSPQANEDNLEFIRWMIDEARTWGAETCIMMGDWHDNRHNLNVQTMDYSLRAMEMLNNGFKTVHWIPGNHDLFYRDRRDISSVVFAKHLPNISIVDNPKTVGGVTLLPWLVGDEGKKLKHTGARYAFGHLELGGFMMNAKVEMPETEHGMKASAFDQLDYCFTGHFHMRQQKNRVVYTGNTMPFNFSDTWDDDRGMMMLEWGKDPVFKSWPNQPQFRSLKLSELLDKPQAVLRDKMTVRVVNDCDVSFEESQILKETFLKDYGLRRFELTNMPKHDSTVEFSGDVIFQSIDQIVEEGLLAMESSDDVDAVQATRLLEIYKSLVIL